MASAEHAIDDATEKIPVYLVNGKPKVWNAKDAVRLREYHRIVGVLVGCLPRHPRQNLHLGLPLQLLPEELTLLRSKGIVRVLKERNTTEEESAQRRGVVREEREANFQLQQALYREDRRQEMLRQMAHIVEGKKAKRHRLMKDGATESTVNEPKPEQESSSLNAEVKTEFLSSEMSNQSLSRCNETEKDLACQRVETETLSLHASTDEKLSLPNTEAKSKALSPDSNKEMLSRSSESDKDQCGLVATEEVSASQCISAEREVIQSPDTEAKMESSVSEEGEPLCLDKLPITATPEKHMLVQLFTENPWHQTAESAEEDWKFPLTAEDTVRCAVFQDLWEKNFYLTSGQKFGGHFLAYPGDPSRFHSFYIVMCVHQEQQLSALDLISMGRLGSNVRKTVLIASLDESGSVKYTSLQWTGMS